MIALTCEWGNDLSVGPGGDISAIPVHDELQQRIVRRLLTSAGEYIWHTDYGAGLGRYVGEPDSLAFIEGVILRHLQLESLVAQTPLPSVQGNEDLSGSFSTIAVTVQYQISGSSLGSSISLRLGG
jgi:hypothetical protein